MKQLLLASAFILIVLLFTGSASSVKTAEQTGEKENYDVTFYFLDLNVSDSSTYLSGSVTISIKPLIASMDQAEFDLSDLLTTDSVHVNGIVSAFTHESNILNVIFPDPASEGSTINVKIFYHGLGSHVQTEGIYHGNAWNKQVTWTLTEPFSALNFFPCKQSLTDKADSVYVFLSTDNDLKAGSNGILTAQIALPNNRIRYEWKSRYPIDYYLISFTVSDYMDYSYYAKIPEFNDSVLVQNYIYNDSNYLELNKENIDKTADLIALYSKLFGLYPFKDEKYGHCVAPFSGGMEHQTMTTLVNFSFLLVAHELTHQWFGDYVTCSTWQDIWINEGFASYGEYIAYQFLVSQQDADNWIESSKDYVKSQPGGSVFVPESSAASEGRIFDSRLSYKKGALIIHMIRQESGSDSVFFGVMSSFLQKYGHSNASGADFRDHLEAITGKDFGQFFDQWYYGEGYPMHSIRWDHHNDTLYINSLQTTSSETPFFNILLEFRIFSESIDTVISFRQDANYKQWQIYFPGTVSGIQPDPNHWLLIEISDISKIDDSDNQAEFTIVPNPARDKVRIETSLNKPFHKYSLFLTNPEGKILIRRESSSPVEEIDVTTYPA